MNTETVGRSWHRLYPERWRHELRALRAAGLRYRIRYPHGGVRLLVDYPLTAERTARLRVDFAMFPWFPPTVIDAANTLGATRHRNPVTGHLCLTHEELGWETSTTVADLLTSQVPKILATNLDHAPDADAADRVDADADAAAVLEAPAPDGANVWRNPYGGPAVVELPDDVPAGCDAGILVARTNPHRAIRGLVVEEMHGPGWTARQDRFHNLEKKLPLTIFGRWLRMPDFDRASTTEALWAQVEPRLAPLALDTAADGDVGTDTVELVGLLVPGEPTYRTRGEEWLFLLVFAPGKLKPGTARRAIRCLTQRLPESGDRTPGTDALAAKHVVVVGLGAIGHHVALGIGRAGVGRVELVDRDVVDIATMHRQFVPLWECGAAKSHVLASGLAMTAPTTRVTGYALDVADLTSAHRDVGDLRRALGRADLVIDATANPSVTRYLGALRHATGLPFLHVSATAGAWGGVVTLTDRTSGCWACIEHHRHDDALPVPPADPRGWVRPAGCGSPTFTGDNASLGSIAMHALRVGLDHLRDGESTGPGIWVAALRDPTGRTQPIAWHHAHIAPHQACPLHDPGLGVQAGAA